MQKHHQINEMNDKNTNHQLIDKNNNQQINEMNDKKDNLMNDNIPK
jgi:hypothetical protein